MIEQQITNEILRYIDDGLYQYAVLIDGEWGCGKTYYVKNALTEAIGKKYPDREVKYISLYGMKSGEEICDAIALSAIGKYLAIVPGHDTKFFSFLTSIGGPAIKKLLGNFAEDLDIKNIAFDKADLSKSIFIFDDVERCECPINQVFGVINDLVEHRELKVILVANEKEISVQSESGRRELQYLIALNEGIGWEDGKENEQQRGQTITKERLESRRRQLCELELDDSGYRKIREKLIGVTLHYQPDSIRCMEAILDKAKFELPLRRTISDHLKQFDEEMQVNGHQNLRTFQFFLSKISYLYQKLRDIYLDPSSFDSIVSYIVENCFTSCVVHKANMKETEEDWEPFFSTQDQIEVIRKYVVSGDLNEKEFVEVIEGYEDRLKTVLPADDPFCELKQKYYIRPQKWVEERAIETLERFSQGLYSSNYYGELILVYCQLSRMGIPGDYFQSLRNEMLQRIRDGMAEPTFDELRWLSIDKEIAKEIAPVISELEAALKTSKNDIRKKTVGDIFESDSWVSDLIAYSEMGIYKDSLDRAVFSKVDSEKVIKKILDASPEEIHEFRKWLRSTYTRSIPDDSLKQDVPALKEIISGIENSSQEDVVYRFNLNYLIKDISLLCEMKRGLA